jgi:hypothetical protein
LTWLDDHPDEVARFMACLIRSDGPDSRRWVEPVYRLRPRGFLSESARQRIDNLSVERQRLICAAGRLLWAAFSASCRTRALGVGERKARIEVARAVLVETLDIFHASRGRAVLALVRAFVDEPISRATVRRLAAQMLSERPHQEQTLLERPSRGP